MMALYEDLPLTTMKLDMEIDLFISSPNEMANSMLPYGKIESLVKL